MNLLLPKEREWQGLIDAEGSDYDPIPLIFGAGFWIDPDL